MLISPGFAHEVYVLSPNQIEHDKSVHSPHVWRALTNAHDLKLFILAVLLTFSILAFALFLKSTSPAKRLGKFIDRGTSVAPDLIRFAFGLSLIVSASKKAVFGPELPLSSFPAPNMLRLSLIIIGVALVLGLFTRVSAWLAVLLFIFVFATKGWYMLTYFNYLGEAIAVALLPCQKLSLDTVIRKMKHTKLPKYRYGRYSMPIARLLFGFSIIYAAVNVKFITSALSLDVVGHYKLTHYFPFDPLFLVLGAGLVECLIGTLYMLGLLQRLNTVFFLIFLTASLLFFKESVWPHYLLIALAIGTFLHKPDSWALDGMLFRNQKASKTHEGLRPYLTTMVPRIDGWILQ